MQLSSALFVIGVLAITFGLVSGCTPKKVAPNSSGSPNSTMLINGKAYQIEIANTTEQQRTGLSGRDQIGSDGMLFVFTKSAKHGFWMVDMKFDLDFIWIKEGVVAEITPDVRKPAPGQPDSQLPQYFPTEPVDMMLEVNAGFADREQIKVGDRVELKK